MRYKKIIVILLAMSISLCLSGCRSKDYKLATKFFTEGEYKRATSFFETARKYKDSLDKVNECKYYVAKQALEQANYEEAILYLTDLDYLDSAELFKLANMHLNSDYSFLNDLEELLTYRFGEGAKKGEEARVLYNKEYEALKKYELAVFYDTNLKQFSKDIINGLKEYAESYENSILSESQYHIYNAQAVLSKSYSELYNNYGFMNGNEDFKKAYIDTAEQSQILASASSKIKADIDNQGTLLANTGTPWTKNKDKLTWTVTNNTEYTYTLKLLVTFYDDTGNSYFTDQVQGKLAPGASQEFKFTVNSKIFSTVTYDYMYQDIY